MIGHVRIRLGAHAGDHDVSVGVGRADADVGDPREARRTRSRRRSAVRAARLRDRSVRVAPNCAAASRRTADGSDTTSSPAPLRAAHAITDSPTGPAPTTSTLSPDRMWARSTACSPTASGSTSAPSAGSRSSGSPTVSRWSTRTYSANAPGTSAHTDHVGLHAVRRFAGEARQAVAASDDRERGDVSTRLATPDRCRRRRRRSRRRTRGPSRGRRASTAGA